MTKKEIMDKILDMLDREKIGITVSRLAQTLDVSRPTIYKYLNLLRKDDLIEEIDVGGSKFWAKKSSSSPGRLSIIRPYRYIFDIMLETLESRLDQKVDWRKIGELMAEKVKEEELLDTEELFDVLIAEGLEPHQLKKIIDDTKKPINNRELFDILKRLAPFFQTLFRLIFTFLDECTIEPAIEVDSPPLLIYRIRDFKLFKDTQILDIFVGLIRKKLMAFFWNGVDIQIDYTIKIAEKIIDLKLGFSKF